MIFEQPNHYTADEGKTFRRKIDNFIMGNDMYLYNFIDGTKDTIDNYEEIDDLDYVPENNENKTEE